MSGEIIDKSKSPVTDRRYNALPSSEGGGQMGRLRGKAAIITGGASGIGRAMALLFAAEGARVGILDREGPRAAEVVREIEAAGTKGYAHEVDLADSQKTEDAVTQVSVSLGGVDILVNNAATYSSCTLDRMARQEWQNILDTNLTAYFVCARKAAVEMYKRGGGSIVNIASIHRLISVPGAGAYAVAKAGVTQLTRSLAMELAPHNILVNSISPGFILTRMSIVDGVDVTTTENFRKTFVESGRLPLGRPGQPDEVAAAALFLAARECGYMTGADLVVDGGLTLTV
jgi:NAD(P)-dependent dehydrogenase (short-subunit alcohol dehydrogenase family)